MQFSDETIVRHGFKYRVYVVNTSGRDWGHVLRDGEEVCRKTGRVADKLPLVLALELRRRVEAGEFDEASIVA